MFLVPVRLSREQKRNCVELFKCLDVDQNGCLDEQEMLGAMLAQGYTQYQLSDARTLIKEYDIDGSGKIELKEFIKMMEHQASEELYKEYCDFIFDYIDRDGSGTITKRELRKMFSKSVANDDVVKMQCEALINSADDNYDGKIDRDEFKQLLRSIPYESLQQSFELFVRGKNASNC
ncbi:uncharacterized protein LOC142334912 [Convolutriloba macropyga]|uniref:uncharacterized protein LOC142334912 n=1 Tax=Convolutriloba macropyga TaxID=536237 RepID=UPI003F524840